MGDDSFGGCLDGGEVADAGGPVGDVREAVGGRINSEGVGDNEGD